MKRNKLIDKVDDVHNWVFFAVRNGKAQAFKSFIENYFYKKGFTVVCNVTPRSIDINLMNDKKGSWEYTRSYLWLEYLRKDISFSNSYSNFAFGIKSIAIGDYFSRTPKMVEEFWSELRLLADSGLLHNEVAELNYPFQLSKNPDFDSISLRKNTEENLINIIDSGKINAKRNVIHSIENLLLKEGYEVEAFLKDDHVLVEFTNTKRGQWKKCECILKFNTKYNAATWNKNIDYTYRNLDTVSIIPPSEKINKHYSHFFDFVSSAEFFEKAQETLDILDYPFCNDSFLSC